MSNDSDVTREDKEVFSILIVDDERNVLSSIRRLLRKVKCQLMLANSGKEALEQLSSHACDLIISDARMPEMNGPELLSQVAVKYPAIQRVLLTGYADQKTTIDAIRIGKINHYSKKPWNDSALLELILHCLQVAKNERELTVEVKAENRAHENQLLEKRLMAELELENIN